LSTFAIGFLNEQGIMAAISLLGLISIVPYLLTLFFVALGIKKCKSPEHIISELPFISIIVAFKNEEKNVANCLKALINQDYPAEVAEIIAVDDHSSDNTLQMIQQLAVKNSQILVVDKPQLNLLKSSKKAALAAGVEASKGEILLFTDADCRPKPEWAKKMVSHYDDSTALVAGFSPQRSGESPLWDGFLLLDSLAAAAVAAASIGWQHGVTCSGRNLSYRTDILKKIGGYENLPNSVSGDDDFVLQAVSRLYDWKVKYSFENASHVPSIGPKNLSRFINQKTRHISASKEYSTKVQLAYFIYHVSNYCLWISAIFVSIHSLSIWPLIIKLAADSLLFITMAKSLKISWRIDAFFLWQLLFPFYHFIAGICGLLGYVTWKTDKD
jgi:cellulose synthase/poly-beta-1,6-N-acetylglucosamine synthase-like glycosyltransferase